ncbi:MAG: redoxin family protein [Candidatus Nitrosocosmicus sp.]
MLKVKIEHASIYGFLIGITIFALVFGYLAYFPSSSFGQAVIKTDGVNALKQTSIAEFSNGQKIDASGIKQAPEFNKTGSSVNINNNSQPLTMAGLKGKVVLVNFWTYSCINVLRTLPYLIDWNAKYADKGLVIVGVHAPEFEFEKNIDNVKNALQRYDIRYPVIQDNDHKIWNAYGNNYWPRMYLADDKGFIRYDKIGEGDYNQTEKVIQSLLSERNANKGIKNVDNGNTTFPYENKSLFNSKNNISKFLAQSVDSSKIKTPELYFGNQSSSSSLGNPQGFHLGQTVTYSLPSPNSTIKPNALYLEGQWANNDDNVELQSDTGRILLNYSAKAVNLVAGDGDGDGDGESQGTVYDDNSLLSSISKGVDIKNDSKFIIDGPRLYNIVNHPSYSGGAHSLLIDIKGKGFQAYVFTFG